MLLARKVPAISWPPSLRTHLYSLVAIGRALFASAVLVVWVLAATPKHPYDHELLTSPRNTRILAQLSNVLSWFGGAIAPSDIERVLIERSTAAIELRDRLLAPMDPLFDLVGVHQRWGLFLMRGRDVYRLQVEGRSAFGEFRLLYRAHQRDELDLASVLSYRRVRGIYNPRGKRKARKQYDGFADWLSATIFSRQPALCEVRIGLVRERLATRDAPNRVRELRHQRTRARGECP